MDLESLVTSFAKTPGLDSDTDYGSDIDVDQLAPLQSTQESVSTNYGSSWTSSALQILTLGSQTLQTTVDPKVVEAFSLVEETVPPPSDYGSDFDSDDERAIAALLDDAENVTVQSVFEVAQDETLQTVARVPKVLSSRQSGNSGSSAYYSALEDPSKSQASENTKPEFSHYNSKNCGLLIETCLTDCSG
jgi:hypothetical protein